MDPRLTELLARFRDADDALTVTELTELDELLRGEFDRLRGEDDIDLVALRAVADDTAAVRERAAEVQAETDRQAQELEDLVAVVHGRDEEDGDGDQEPEPTPTADEGQPAEEDPPVPDDDRTEDPEDEPQAVAAAARPPLGRISTRARGPEAAQAVLVTSRPTTTIVAAGDVAGASTGQVIDFDLLAKAMADKLEASKTARSRLPVATFRAEVDGEWLSSGNTAGRNQAIVAAAQDQVQSAIVASGGFCATPTPLYDFVEIHTDEVPTLAALARIPSPRGRVTFMPPALLTDLDSGITIHTNADDEASATKPCVTVTCPSETTVTMDAIPLCVRVGNFDRMTFPEHFAHWMSLGMGQHARTREKHLLDGINTNSEAVTDSANLGAARDALEAIGRQAAARRWHFRMGANAPVVMVAPWFLRDMIRADLVREAPGSSEERLATSDAQIANFFAVRNITPVWSNEVRTGGPQFADQVAGPGQVWPATVEVFLFHPRAHFLIELPELNLGTDIRDTDLISTNDVQAFLETFQAVGFNGYWSTRLTLTLCVDGSSSLPIDFSGCAGS